MTLVRYYPAAVRNGPYVYVLGGIRYIEGQGSPTVAMNERYDPDTDSWATRAPMPQPRSEIAATSLGGFIHVLSLTDHWVYDPAADQWTERAPLPTAVIGATILDGTLHAVTPSSHLEWVPSNDTWREHAALASPGSHPLFASVEGKILVVASSGTQSYDPKADAWVAKAKIPTPRSVISGSFQTVIDGRVLVAGGGAAATEAYDPTTDEWVTLKPGPTSRDAQGSTVLCGRLYQIGGSYPGYSYADNDVYNLR
jgi:hypothetical protein